MFLKWCIRILLFFVLLENIVQYHQSDYNIKLTILNVTYYNRSYGRDIKAGLQWYNRTTRVINGNGTLIKDLGMDLKFHVQVYKFLSNEYRFFPITMNFHMCREIPTNIFGLKDLLKKYSNMPLTCPTGKGFYYMRNGQVDFSQFPPYIPSGDYKLEAKMFNGEDYMAQMDIYGSVKDNRTLW